MHKTQALSRLLDGHTMSMNRFEILFYITATTTQGMGSSIHLVEALQLEQPHGSTRLSSFRNHGAGKGWATPLVF